MVQDSAVSFLENIEVSRQGGPLPGILFYFVFFVFFVLMSSHYPYSLMEISLGCSRFARRYYGNRVCFLFLQLLRCFNSLGCLFPTYEFCWKLYRLPYSGISGSKFVANSPERFAGICALLRLWVPRSPP